MIYAIIDADDPDVNYNASDNIIKPFTNPPNPFNHSINNDTFAEPFNNYINHTPIYDNTPFNAASAPSIAADEPIDVVWPINSHHVEPNIINSTVDNGDDYLELDDIQMLDIN